MTYESALDWAEMNLPMAMFDDFDSWFDAIENNFNTPSLTDSPKFQSQARELWERNMGRIIEREQEEIPERVTVEIDTATNEIESIKPVGVTQPINIPIQVDERERIIPETGRAPELPKPVIRESLVQKIVGFFRRLI